MSFSGKSNAVIEATLTNDGFFPDLSLSEFQRVYRIPAEYHGDMVAAHVRQAMLDINFSLAMRKAEWLSSGVASLAEANGEQLDGHNVLVLYYLRAVSCRAKASLLNAFATMNRRAQAENLAKESDEAEQSLLSDSVRALRRLLGAATGITAELL
ncbi:head completion/stabilization protein [Hahella sp. CR1]|uniref:head completion/stabilization protein n=1 Tax=Hahella sp. CR1 TaxID=2992807 RepID=UPI002441F808|nr:head completion/stabilization protein [Hahella sp. CR1]MDG9666735.1 head completion/stabilization protein [Hahella sp. CR1]